MICNLCAKNSRLFVSNMEKDGLGKILFLLLTRIKAVAITRKVKKGNSAKTEQIFNRASGSKHGDVGGTEPWQVAPAKIVCAEGGIFVVHVGVDLFLQYKERQLPVFYQFSYCLGREAKQESVGRTHSDQQLFNLLSGTSCKCLKSLCDEGCGKKKVCTSVEFSHTGRDKTFWSPAHS